MTNTKYFGELEIEESDDRFETFEAVPDASGNKVHHIRVSAKLDDGDLDSIAVQPFVDESSPHFNMGVQFAPENLDDVIDGLERIRMNHL